MFRKYRIIWVSSAIIALLLSMVGVSFVMADSANNNSESIIRAAYQKVNGMLRILDADEDPRPSEEYIEWNVGGPAGSPGPIGEQGPQGP